MSKLKSDFLQELAARGFIHQLTDEAGLDKLARSEGLTGYIGFDCTAPSCGDGLRNSAAGEGCDDGNTVNTDNCTMACVPSRCGDGIVQIPPEMMHYGATKTMQLGISRGLAELTAGTGVTVNSVLPGPTFSEGVSEFVVKMGGDSHLSAQEQTDDFVREHRPTSLLRRAATTDEVANLVVYLSSPQASATVGAAVSVDGGTRRAIF